MDLKFPVKCICDLLYNRSKCSEVFQTLLILDRHISYTIILNKLHCRERSDKKKRKKKRDPIVANARLVFRSASAQRLIATYTINSITIIIIINNYKNGPSSCVYADIVATHLINNNRVATNHDHRRLWIFAYIILNI